MAELELLSRWLDGELSDEEVARLRGRLSESPALAAAWSRMQSLPHALADLPLPPPPAGLDDRLLTRLAPPHVAPRPAAASRAVIPVVEHPPADRAPADRRGHAPRPPEPSPSGRPPRARPALPAWVVTVGLAAALAAFALQRPAPVPQLVLSSGVQRVEGVAHVLAGDRVLDVDGTIQVEVTPPRGSAHPVDPDHVFAAGVGTLATVTVFDGSAVLHAPDGTAERLQAGDTRRFDAPRRPTRSPAALVGSPVAEDLTGTVQRLSAENAILRGQLAGREGVPTPWPPDLPPLYRADGFEARSRALLADVPGAELVRWDCDEYPCVAYYRLGDSSRPIADALREPLEATYGEDAGILLFGVQDTDNDQRPVSLAAVAVIPEERGPTFDAVRSRSITRVQDALDDIAAEP